MGILGALSRRRMLGAVGALGLLPARGLSAESPQPSRAVPVSGSGEPRTEFLLAVQAEVTPATFLGEGGEGLRRLMTVAGGVFEGPRLRGHILPGGEFWQLERPDGVTTLEARFTLKATDGSLLSMTHRGLAAPGAQARTVPEIEAPAGLHDWLNRAVFIGSLDASESRQGRVLIQVFQVV